MFAVRSLAASLLTLIAVGFGVVGLAAPAQAEDPYAYWLYYTVEDGAFVYQETEGPGTFVPEDGGIEAFRYASALYPPTQAPRADLTEVTFEAVCGDTEAVDGKKRVAVLIDYGLDGDAPGDADEDAPDPRAECAAVPVDATGYQTLSAVAEIRTDADGGVCGVDGYPAAGDCFPPGDEVTPEDSGPVEFTIAADGGAAGGDEDDDSNWPLLAGAGALVVALVGNAHRHDGERAGGTCRGFL